MKNPLSSSQVLIVGLVRNCEHIIEREVLKIGDAFSEAKNTNFLIIESDSEDGTLNKLKKMSDNNKFEYITLGKLQDQYPKRTERIAFCRNRYLKEIKIDSKYDDIDYVVVADLDGVNPKLTKKSVQSCWDLSVDWDACFANQCAPYYDIWALRHELWNPVDCYAQATFLKKYEGDDFYNLYISNLSKMIFIPEDAAPIRVQSAFGGLAIYKKQCLLKGEYLGVNDNGDEVCEHVHLHLNHMNDARLYIVPSLINCGWNEHSKKRSKMYMFILFIATRFFPIDKINAFKTYMIKKLC
jgi:hypothetical protein